MANGIQYSASDYGNAAGGTALDTYKDEIAQSEKDLAAVATAAKMSVLQKQEKDRVNATAVYGQALGNMYEGDRAAVEMMRDHVRNQFESGGYQKDPESYAKAVAQLNNMSTKFSSFHTETYGTGSANGQGTTYMDMQFNQSRGVENPYEAEGMKYNPENDPFDQAQSTLEFMNRGGYAPNSLRVNEDGIMMARAITYSRDGNHIIGEEMPLDQLPHRQAGAQAFMPDLVENNQSMHDLAIKDKSGILAIQGLIDPKTNKPYTIDDANERYFRNNVAEDPRFLRDVLRNEKDITPDMIEAYGNGTASSNTKIHIESTLYGGADTKGLLGDWQDAARFGTGGDPEATPTTLTHRVAADMPTQSSPGGGITQYSENYNVNAESITPIPITNSQHGDYSIEGISQDHLGNRYVLIPKKTRVFIGPEGEPRTWESLSAEEKAEVSYGDNWDIEDRDMPEYVMISGDVGAYPDPRVAEILQNLPNLGERFTRIGVESQNSYNTIQENYNLRLQREQQISDANSEVDPVEDVLESSTNPNTGGGVSTQSANTGGGVSTQSANTGGGNIIDQFTRSLQGAEGAVPTTTSTTTPLTAASTASAQNPADVLTGSEERTPRTEDMTEDDAQAKLRREEVVAEAQGRPVDYNNIGFDDQDQREGESVGQSMERQERTKKAVEEVSAINFEGDFWGSSYGDPEKSKIVGVLDPSTPEYEFELQAAIGKFGYPPEGSIHKVTADGLIDQAEFAAAIKRGHARGDYPDYKLKETVPLGTGPVADGGLLLVKDDPNSWTKPNRKTAYSNAINLAKSIGAPFPEVMAAQYAIESGFGSSKRMAKDNNFFGVKYNERDAKKFKENGINVKSSGEMETQEQNTDGSFRTIKDEFFAFDTPADSFKAYVMFIENNPRYKEALKATTEEDYLRAIKKAGYATDDKYVDKILKIADGFNMSFRNPTSETDEVALNDDRLSETSNVTTSEAELTEMQEGGVIRNPDPNQINIAIDNAPATQEIINSEATTGTQEASDLIVNEMQNSSEVISAYDLTQMTPVDLAMKLVGKHEREDREFVQGMMDRWIGKDELDVTKGTGAWCAAFVSSVLADTGHEDALDPVRSGEAYSEPKASQYNYVRARAFEAIGKEVSLTNAAVGDVIVIVGARGGSSRHVGFFNGYDSRGNVRILGGNQGIRGGEVSNMTLADLNKVVAIRRPFEGSATESQIAEVSEAIAIPTDISASNSTLR